MAGDWIKIETTIHDKPEVWAIAAALQIDSDAVVGKLAKVWIWFDKHTSTGNANSVTSSVAKALLDHSVGVSGFCNAMVEVGWMQDDGVSLSLPKFDRHNGQTAKTRAETNKRVAKHRNAKCVTDVTQKPLPEKRREEKRREEDLHTHTHVDEKSHVIIPEWVPREKWSDYLDVWRVRHGNGRIMDGPTQEMILMKLHGAYAHSGEAKALCDLAFMIERQSKAYLDSANDFQKRGGGGLNGGERKTRGQQAMESLGL